MQVLLIFGTKMKMLSRGRDGKDSSMLELVYGLEVHGDGDEEKGGAFISDEDNSTSEVSETDEEKSEEENEEDTVSRNACREV